MSYEEGTALAKICTFKTFSRFTNGLKVRTHLTPQCHIWGRFSFQKMPNWKKYTAQGNQKTNIFSTLSDIKSIHTPVDVASSKRCGC